MPKFVLLDASVQARQSRARISRPGKWAAPVRYFAFSAAILAGMVGATQSQATASYLLAYPGAPYDGAS